MPNSVALLVLTYGNRQRFLERTLEAVARSTRVPDLTLIVDNGCDPVVHLPARPAPVQVLRLETNLGSAGGYHAGLKHLLEIPGWTHVWMLDDDNAPHPECLNELSVFLDKLSENTIAVAHRPDRREFVALLENGGQPPPRRNSFQGFSLSGRIRDLFHRAGPRSNPEAIPLFGFGYGGALVPRAALHDGHCLPDPRLFLYHDDSEWAWRLGKSGCRAFLCRTATIEDIDPPWGGFVRNGASPLFSRQTEPRKLWYSLRNRAWLERDMGFSGLGHDLNAALWIALMSIRTFLAERSVKQILARARLASRAYRTGSAGRLDPWPFG